MAVYQLTRPQRKLLKRAERVDPNPAILEPRDYDDAMTLQEHELIEAGAIAGLDKMGAVVTEKGREEARRG